MVVHISCHPYRSQLKTTQAQLDHLLWACFLANLLPHVTGNIGNRERVYLTVKNDFYFFPTNCYKVKFMKDRCRLYISLNVQMAL